jgi:diguanylate cyclase (GGDEF)-like protein/PAS domain S-box-containing protein
VSRLRSGGTVPALTRDPVLIGLGLFAAGTSIWLVLGSAGIVLSWLAQVGLDVMYMVSSWRVATLLPKAGPARRFWRCMALAGLFFTMADTYQSVLTVSQPPDAAVNSPVQTVLVVSGVACAVWGMLTHPLEVTGRERLRLWLDAATVMAAVAAFAWALVIAGSGGSTVDMATGLIGSGLMLVCTLGVVKLVLSGAPPFVLPAGIAGGLGTALSGVGLLLNGPLAHTRFPELVTIARLLPCVLIAATPRIQEVYVRTHPGILDQRRRRYSVMPYIAVGGTQALLVSMLLTDGLSAGTWGAIAGVVAITALVVIRQLVAFRDNTLLLDELGRQEERFRSLVQHASDITVVLDGSGVVTYASPALHRVLGLPVMEATGTPVSQWVHPEDRTAARRMGVALFREPRVSHTIQLRVWHRDDSWHWLEVVASNLLGTPGVGGIVLNARDVTESRELHDQLRHEATHDPLTQLGNRALFQERLRLAELPPRATTDLLSVIAIDLNGFKAINDTLGHHVGDALLVAVARRLPACVRPSDTVARLGGDEFAVLLPQTSRAGAAIVVDRITAAFAEPVEVDGHVLPIRASLGLATGPAADTEALLRRADAAMYSAKRESKAATA